MNAKCIKQNFFYNNKYVIEPYNKQVILYELCFCNADAGAVDFNIKIINNLLGPL